MSCYNSERYLRASIDSIIAQDFKDFEFIIAYSLFLCKQSRIRKGP